MNGTEMAGVRLKSLGFMLVVVGAALLARAAEAADVRAIEFLGLRAGATIEQVDAQFPLETRVIYSEPDLPSLGVYYYRAIHEARSGDSGERAMRLQADFDRAQRLFRWNLVLTGPDTTAFDRMLDDIIAENGPGKMTLSGASRMLIYSAPWGNGIVGPEVRLRFVVDKTDVRTDAELTTNGRMTINYIDYRADEDNTRAAYYGAVDEERRRVGGPEHEPDLNR